MRAWFGLVRHRHFRTGPHLFYTDSTAALHRLSELALNWLYAGFRSLKFILDDVVKAVVVPQVQPDCHLSEDLQVIRLIRQDKTRQKTYFKLWTASIEAVEEGYPRENLLEGC